MNVVKKKEETSVLTWDTVELTGDSQAWRNCMGLKHSVVGSNKKFSRVFSVGQDKNSWLLTNLNWITERIFEGSPRGPDKGLLRALECMCFKLLSPKCEPNA